MMVTFPPTFLPEFVVCFFDRAAGDKCPQFLVAKESMSHSKWKKNVR
jgi:hypothetical protein